MQTKTAFKTFSSFVLFITLSMTLVLALFMANISFANSDYDILAKLKNLEQKMNTKSQMTCVPDGLDCQSSLECCGASSCWQNRCNSGGPSCGSEGATCNSSIDCCGSLSCWRGRCDGGGTGCYPKGAICSSSIECCGSLSCWQGRCD